MNQLNTLQLKTKIRALVLSKGADLCGFAALERFAESPPGFHPRDVYPDCQAFIGFLRHFPASSLSSYSMAPYSFIRNMMVQKIDWITYEICDELEAMGHTAIPIPCNEPYEYWDPEQRHGRSIVSLKHAAQLAGLGIIGKNTLLINDQFGNMFWLGGILTSVRVESDPLAMYSVCNPDCTICLDGCPVSALDGTTISQSRCREYSMGFSEGGGMIYRCNTCRVICPNHRGVSFGEPKTNNGVEI